MNRKLPKEAFYAQFHNHEQHVEAQDHERPYSHEVPDHPAAGPNPNYRSKKRHPKKAIHKALDLTAGR